MSEHWVRDLLEKRIACTIHRLERHSSVSFLSLEEAVKPEGAKDSVRNSDLNLAEGSDRILCRRRRSCRAHYLGISIPSVSTRHRQFSPFGNAIYESRRASGSRRERKTALRGGLLQSLRGDAIRRRRLLCASCYASRARRPSHRDRRQTAAARQEAGFGHPSTVS